MIATIEEADMTKKSGSARAFLCNLGFFDNRLPTVVNHHGFLLFLSWRNDFSMLRGQGVRASDSEIHQFLSIFIYLQNQAPLSIIVIAEAL